MLEWFKEKVDWYLAWRFRRSIPTSFIRVGITLIVVSAVGGYTVSWSHIGETEQLALQLDLSGGGPILFAYLGFVLGVFFLLSGAVWHIRNFLAEQREADRKKTIVVEARGLQDVTGTPLLDTVSSYATGKCEGVVVDLRQGVPSGADIDPCSAIKEITYIPRDLKRMSAGMDRKDVKMVYGGMTPVPFTFLTGMIFDDEGEVELFDWDRHQGCWRNLDGSDDNQRFEIIGRADLMPSSPEVTLAVSVSYPVDIEAVRTQFSACPIVELRLDGGGPDSHWSETKQLELGRQFLEVAIGLTEVGCQHINLVLAAPNSVVFRFGRLYDRRNLPALSVYQYERGEQPSYPWAVSMPVAGAKEPCLVCA